MIRLRSLLPALLLSLVLPFVVVPTVAAAATPGWDAPIDLTFPVAGDDHRYIDDYRFPRSRGAHGATDIMAPPGAPIVAAMGGTITWVSTPATSGCGYCIDVRGTDGRTYGYIHLGPKAAGRTDDAFARSWREGDRVARGQLLGFNGCSGNASCSSGGHHLHFIIEDPAVVDPYGDRRRNPYASLRAADCDPSPRGSFVDVCAGSTHERDIERLFASSLTNGCGEDRFCPEQPVTRDQMASFLVRALELRGRDRTPFRDVGEANVHYRTIARLAEEGITRGCGDAVYCPEDGVTRAQMASFLVRALELSPRRGPVFDDVRSSNVHARDIAALAAAGITRGCGDDEFCPDRVVSRQEMASFLVRAFLD